MEIIETDVQPIELTTEEKPIETENEQKPIAHNLGALAAFKSQAH